MIPGRRFFVRYSSGSHEVVWKLHLGGTGFHAVRPKGSVTVCGKKIELVDPPAEVPDPSNCKQVCPVCEERVIRIVDNPKPVDLRLAIWRARRAQN